MSAERLRHTADFIEKYGRSMTDAENDAWQAGYSTGLRDAAGRQSAQVEAATARTALIKLAAEMARKANMPNADRSWYVSTPMSERREILREIEVAEEQCNLWAMAVRKVADGLPRNHPPAQAEPEGELPPLDIRLLRELVSYGDSERIYNFCQDYARAAIQQDRSRRAQPEAEPVRRCPTADDYAHPVPSARGREPVILQFPTVLRQMWSGREVQEWIDEQGPLYRHPAPSAQQAAPEGFVLEAQRIARWCEDAAAMCADGNGNYGSGYNEGKADAFRAVSDRLDAMLSAAPKPGEKA